MAKVENPILNSPFEEPAKYWELSEEDYQPTGFVHTGRRPSAYIVPVAAPKKSGPKQDELELDELDEAEGARFTPNDFINEIRKQVDSWRELSPSQWAVTHETARLLQHWRGGGTTQRLFFCQIEAVETMIWLAEVAPKRFRDRLKQLNEEPNPGLFRIASKMATGSGKTTVMAMLIAWQAVNAARGRTSFSDAFLIICPGITVKNRLNVLLPSDPKNYYEDRNLVPVDMIEDVRNAEIVITNYHAFKPREKAKIPKDSRRIIEGRGAKIDTLETDGVMLDRACGDVLARKNVIVINDEAHHCYQRKEGEKEKIAADEKEETKKRDETARLWISGIKKLHKKIGVRTVYDLSATPFFLNGSGYREGSLFPWVVSDFSLMDAIESGIVKIPRLPVSDDSGSGGDGPVWRSLWKHLKEDQKHQLPVKGRRKQSGKGGALDPANLPPKLMGAIGALYSHYEKTFEQWKAAFSKADFDMRPVFIVVCQNTSISKLVCDYISGYEREEKTPQGEVRTVGVPGALPLFNNYEKIGQDWRRLDRPNTLLVDSSQLDSGEAMTPEFKKIAAAEIEAFKKDLIYREGQAAADKIKDEDLLREVMNTVGKPGRLGEKIRCVVSVSMLTEGWDANTVTHILGVRAFGTQLLCEQVVGRGLRRVSYDADENGMFEPEYADIFGIPFLFMAGSGDQKIKPPKPLTRIHTVRSKIEKHPILDMRFPRVQGYRVKLPSDKLVCAFTEESKYLLDPSITPVRGKNEAIIGKGVTLSIDELRKKREKTVYFQVAGHALRSRFRDDDGNLKPYLFPQLLKITEQWFEECLVVKGDCFMQMLLWPTLADEAALRIYNACTSSTEQGKENLLPILNPYNQEGGCAHIDFMTSKERIWTAGETRCPTNKVVGDSDWEITLCENLEDMPEVLAYVKNQGLGFDVPYADAEGERRYWPDFILRIDDGAGESDPLNLVTEVKGFVNRDVALKKDTMNRLWVPAVNNHGGFGRWDFVELTDVFDQKKAVRDHLAARLQTAAME